MQIINMELVSQENMVIGEPKPCQFLPTGILTSVLAKNASDNKVVMSTSQQRVCEAEHVHIKQESILEGNCTSIVQLSPSLAKQ